MRVIGYVRVSTEEQAHGGVSLAAQARKIAVYAKLYDVEVVTVVEDPGVSGKTLDRPGLTSALNMLAAGNADGILVAKLDRLTRSVADVAVLIERYFSERAGKSLLCVADQVDTRTAAGRLVLNVLVSVAQWERETGAERTSEALRHKRARGEVYGTVPLGYDRTDGGRLSPIPEELETVARIRDLRRRGLSLRKVAATMTLEGRKTKNGGRWHATTVSKVLNRDPVGEAS